MARTMRREPREITGRFVLICLLAFFGVVVVVNMVMARFAITTFGGVEVASSYKAGLAFAAEAAAARRRHERHWRLDVSIAAADGDRRVLTLAVADADGRPLSGLGGNARLVHPTDERRDVGMALSPLGGGRYRATGDAPAGQWELIVDLTQADERVFQSKNRVVLH